MSRSMFQRACTLHRQGRLDEAARDYEAVLAAEPRHADALTWLGVLRLGQSRPTEAEGLLRRAVSVAPNLAEAQANLAAVLQTLGRREEAANHYRQALTLQPNMTEARFGLAACLQALGHLDAAVACYEMLLAAEPAHAEANFGLATLLAALGRADQATARYRAAIAADADFAEAHYGLGVLVANDGRLAEAIGCFNQALDVDPDYTDARLALARVLARQEQDDQAISAFRAILAGEPGHVDALIGLAWVLSHKHEHAEALRQFDAALAREPDHLDALTGRAAALLGLDRHAEAIALCHAVLKGEPNCAPALDILARALGQTGDLVAAEVAADQAIALAPERLDFCFTRTQLAMVRPGDTVLHTLLAMLRRAAPLPPREQYLLHFALAKALSDTGEPERAFHHLLEGNAIKRRGLDYDEAHILGTCARVRETFSAELIASRGGRGAASDVPVFVIGMPRSGTTLVEQVLASHPAVFGAGERQGILPLVAHRPGSLGGLAFPEAVVRMSDDELRRTGEAYLAALRACAPEARRITDKGLGNHCFAGLIHLILPNARIISVNRDPVDTCLSCFSKLFEEGQAFSYDLGELGRYWRAHRRLMQHWHDVLPGRVLLEVQYERLVADFPAEARRIVAHCGLLWDDACLEFHKTSRPVRTASMTQVRQPIYRTSVGRWRPDAALLRPLLDGLGLASGE